MESLDGAGLVGAGAAEKSDLCDLCNSDTIEQIKACSGPWLHSTFTFVQCTVVNLKLIFLVQSLDLPAELKYVLTCTVRMYFVKGATTLLTNSKF